MALATATVLDQRSVLNDGTIQIRLAKQIINGGDVMSSEWHRLSLEPGCSVDEILAANNAHLQAMGYPEIFTDDQAKIRTMVAAEQTPDVVASYQAAKALEPTQ